MAIRRNFLLIHISDGGMRQGDQLLAFGRPCALISTVSETNSLILGDVIDGLQEKGFEIGDPNDLIK